MGAGSIFLEYCMALGRLIHNLPCRDVTQHIEDEYAYTFNVQIDISNPVSFSALKYEHYIINTWMLWKYFFPGIFWAPTPTPTGSSNY